MVITPNSVFDKYVKSLGGMSTVLTQVCGLSVIEPQQDLGDKREQAYKEFCIVAKQAVSEQVLPKMP